MNGARFERPEGDSIMKTSWLLSAISFGLVFITPACSGKFLPIGTDNDAGAGGADQGVGGSTGVTCLYNNVNYEKGASFKSTDGCNNCSCSANGLVACTAMACLATGGSSGVGGSTGVTCLYNNVNYTVGSSFKSSDGCNTCSCTSSGQVACTAMACLASGGSSGVGGSTSACVCTGPAPGAPTILCWDGSTGGPVCATSSAGTCSWQIRSCPPNPGAGGTTGAGGATGTSSCVTAADCKGALPALCEQCTNGGSGCAHFVCNSGSCEIAYCDSATCLSNGVNYATGSSFPSPDGCNTCSCTASGVVICTKIACPAPGSGGASSVGGAGQGGGTSCPPIPLVMPKCDTGTAILKYDPSTGCPTGYGCPTCPAVNLPNITCTNYQIVTDPTTGCPTGYTCPTLDASTCPPIALVVPVCPNATALLKYDPSTGCATGYGCP